MNLKEKFIKNLQRDNVQTQKGLIEIFDSTIGRSTVLMPFGGKTQRTETQVSVQKLPVGNHFTNAASMMSYGYNPDIATWSPFHGAEYAVVEAITKIVAAGGRYQDIRFSFQEYFEKLGENPIAWGKPTAALLGALQMQRDFGLPAIGGKDSMSGTFHDINVPPMLMAFAVSMVDAREVISTEFKEAGSNVYIIRHHYNSDFTPNTAELKQNFDYLTEQIKAGKVLAAYAVGFGGIAEGLAKMTFGNEIGVEIEQRSELEEFESLMFDLNYGTIIVETKEQLSYKNAQLLGKTTQVATLSITLPDGSKAEFTIDELYRANTEKFATVYPMISRK